MRGGREAWWQGWDSSGYTHLIAHVAPYTSLLVTAQPVIAVRTGDVIFRDAIELVSNVLLPV